MAVKHTPTDIVHKGTKGGTTGCGVDTNVKSDHWVNTSSRIDCDKNGCKNQSNRQVTVSIDNGNSYFVDYYGGELSTVPLY